MGGGQLAADELHLGQGLAPAAVLKRAQTWFREATRAELVADKLAALETELFRGSYEMSRQRLRLCAAHRESEASSDEKSPRGTIRL
jgi:hypothetical protein